MQITSVESTGLFLGSAARPLQVVRVALENAGAAMASGSEQVTITVHGPAVTTPEPVVLSGMTPGEVVTAEVGVEIAAPAQPGSTRNVLATAAGPAGTIELAALITVAEPGWVMWMISHFHYDPVWWDTQGQFLQTRLLLPGEHGEMPEVGTAFELVRLHLDAARHDPDYKFVLAEIDYLKPHFDAHPEDRADLLDFIKAGRIELVGGSYNEPNTNLTCAESTIRNAVYGTAYQRDVLGAGAGPGGNSQQRRGPRTAWMLDAFGFDPGYPGLMAAAGLTESSWARGPFHQWGPNRSAGDNRLMQFSTEFEWLSPDGTGLLTSYMANHYSAGWLAGYHARTLEQAEADAYQQFTELAPVATTRNVLLPVGGDHVVPPRWATEIHRDWNSRYVWPRFVTAVPSEFFAAVRTEAAERGIWITPQTRDMNPLYTGKDVSYIDTKQGQRAAEVAVLDGERLATLAWLTGARYPVASLDKAWRQLAFGAHHDAITGTEGDQVYLDLLGGWREAWERGDSARRAAIAHLAGLADTASLEGSAPSAQAGQSGQVPQPLAIVVVNSLSMTRTAMATVRLELPASWPAWLELIDDTGAPVPFLATGAGRGADGGLAALTLTFRAAEVPGVGYRSYLVRPAAEQRSAGWEPAGETPLLENDAFLVRADPGRGGTLSRVLDKRSGTDLLVPDGRGNELLLQPEHAAHPRWGEGPWLLCPAGPARGSASLTAVVRAERCPVGSRLVATLAIDDLRVTQETLLWDGSDRIEFRTHVDGSIGQDKLLRVSFPASVTGGLPVYQTAVSVIGRPPGGTDIDVAEHPYTLDSPALEWFAVGSTARVALPGPDGPQLQAVGVAEVICPPALRESARGLLAALASQGVTATCSVPGGPRYGFLDLDSNLPDFRICLGGPEGNELTARVLAAAGPQAAESLTSQLVTGQARLWVPAVRTRSDAFGPGPDVRGPLDLPVLIIAAEDMAAEIDRLISDLADAVIEVPRAAGRGEGAGGAATELAGHSVALLNRGTPSGLVTPEGTLTMALMRACSAWPCGVWIEGDKRATPDGSSFAWQHWSHTFEYALAAGPGDWRTAGFAASGQDYNHELLTVVTGLHAGPLPARAALATVEPASALLSALKPYGNPLAPAGQPERADGVTVRVRDLGGLGPQEARVRLHGGLSGVRAASLCEDSTGAELPLRDGAAAVAVPGAGVATAVLSPAGTVTDAADAGEEAGDPPEPAQPVYSRYWLHGKGPAPAGNMPVAVHLSPGQAVLDGGHDVLVRLTVACGPQAAAGHVEVTVPDGIRLTPVGSLRYDLPPLGYQSFDLAVQADANAGPARSFLTASITDPSGQVIEDSVLLTVGQPGPLQTDLPILEVAEQQQAVQAAQAGELEMTLAADRLTLHRGETRPIEVLLTNRCASAIRGEAQLLSPYGSWHQAGPWTTGFSAAPGSGTTVSFDVAASPTARPGEQWWAIVKIMYFGRARYTEPVLVTVS